MASLGRSALHRFLIRHQQQLHRQHPISYINSHGCRGLLRSSSSSPFSLAPSRFFSSASEIYKLNEDAKTGEAGEPIFGSDGLERVDPPKPHRSEIEEIVMNEARERAALHEVLRKHRTYTLGKGRLGRRDRWCSSEAQYNAWLKEVEKKYDASIDYTELQHALLRTDDSLTDILFDDCSSIIATGEDLIGGSLVDSAAEEIERKLKEVDLMRDKFDHWYRVDYQRHVLRTFRGKEESYSCLLIAGDGKGLAGFGLGRKAKDPMQAEVRATMNIRKTLMFLPMLERRTVTRHITGKFCKTYVKMWPLHRGAGTKAGKITFAVFECFGLMDITAKVHGRMNSPRHVVYATFDGLANQPSARDMCLARGISPYKLFEPRFYDPPPPSYEEMKERREHVSTILRNIRKEKFFDSGYAPEDREDYDQEYEFDQRLVMPEYHESVMPTPRD